jgi:Tfp pilus assembly protein PilF
VRLKPEHILAEATVLFDAGRNWEVVERLEPMIQRAEGLICASAITLLAKTYMKNFLWKKLAEGVLQSLVKEDSRYLAAHLLLGELYHSTHLSARARSMYRRVLEIQPGNREATEALAFLQQSEESPPASKKFTRLFRKR